MYSRHSAPRGRATPAASRCAWHHPPMPFWSQASVKLPLAVLSTMGAGAVRRAPSLVYDTKRRRRRPSAKGDVCSRVMTLSGPSGRGRF